MATRGITARLPADAYPDRMAYLPDVLIIDAVQRLAFIACEGNDRLVVLDMRTMRVTASFEVGKDPDVLAYDSSLQLLYVAGGAGVVSMFRVEVAAASKLGKGLLGPNAHVVAVDPETHRSPGFGLRTVLQCSHA